MRPIRPILVTAACALLAGAVSGCASSGSPSWTFAPSASAAASAAAPVAADTANATGATTGTSSSSATTETDSDTTAAGGATGTGNAMPGMAAISGALPTRGSGGAALGAAEPPATAASVDQTTRLDLTIVTGDMINHTEFPAYVPSDFSLPANSTVVVSITNFDDATPLPPSAAMYASATGIVGGTFTVTPIKAAYPNRAGGATRTLSALNPNEVSHTFTIPALGINVPVAPFARTTFTIHTGAPGTFAWRCFDPCGTGTTGWGSAMGAKQGFMEGTLTVA